MEYRMGSVSSEKTPSTQTHMPAGMLWTEPMDCTLNGQFSSLKWPCGFTTQSFLDNGISGFSIKNRARPKKVRPFTLHYIAWLQKIPVECIVLQSGFDIIHEIESINSSLNKLIDISRFI